MLKLLSGAALIAMMSVPAHAAVSLHTESPASLDRSSDTAFNDHFLAADHVKDSPLKIGGTDTLTGKKATAGSQTPAVSAVPEAGTWAMMLAGVTIVGFAMRRRTRVRKTNSFI